MEKCVSIQKKWLQCQNFAFKIIHGMIFSNIRKNNILKIEDKNLFSSKRIKNKTFKKIN